MQRLSQTKEIQDIESWKQIPECLLFNGTIWLSNCWKHAAFEQETDKQMKLNSRRDTVYHRWNGCRKLQKLKIYARVAVHERTHCRMSWTYCGLKQRLRSGPSAVQFAAKFERICTTSTQNETAKVTIPLFLSTRNSKMKSQLKVAYQIKFDVCESVERARTVCHNGGNHTRLETEIGAIPWCLEFFTRIWLRKWLRETCNVFDYQKKLNPWNTTLNASSEIVILNCWDWRNKCTVCCTRKNV